MATIRKIINSLLNAAKGKVTISLFQHLLPHRMKMPWTKQYKSISFVKNQLLRNVNDFRIRHLHLTHIDSPVANCSS